MIVLGFDTATSATVVGLSWPDPVVADGSTTLERWEGPDESGRPRHTTRMLMLAHELARDAGIELGSVDRVVAGVGPGGFTGLRVGLATATACARAAGAELVGVSSLRALAHNARGRPVIAVIDARRGEAFAACFHGEVMLCGPAVLAPRALTTLAGQPAPAQAGWLAIGDGAVLYAPQLREAGAEVPAPDSPLHRISGVAVCARGRAAQAPRPRAALTPDYVRAPDALPTAARSPHGRHPTIKTP